MRRADLINKNIERAEKALEAGNEESYVFHMNVVYLYEKQEKCVSTYNPSTGMNMMRAIDSAQRSVTGSIHY